jgi:hypothetical protein
MCEGGGPAGWRPRARIALLTVFAAQSGPTAALSLVNDAIIAAARAADPHVIVMSPLGVGWSAHGVAPAAGHGAVICDSGAGQGPRSPRFQ